MPTPDEQADYCLWWEHNNIVLHILMTCLNAITHLLLPYDNNDPSSNCCTHLIYNTLCEAYHI